MRIALADDHTIMREGVRMILADHESIDVVGEVGDGAELLALLESTEVDAILMDLEMPGMGGLEALVHLRSRFPKVAIVILSMHDRLDFVRKAISRGAGGYLLKSASREEMIRALETVVAGGNYLQPELVGPLVADMNRGSDSPTSLDLTERELEVLHLLAKGLDTPAMAEAMGIGAATVRTHVKNLLTRLEVRNRAEAVAVGLRLGLID